ncbi:MAG: bifunctional phosphoribosylaminoimidazolecarboxamide formyltransferase/IMP cyclohydrolase [Candidatus Omnitrophota bacterium]
MVKVNRALLSVSDKTGIVEFAKGLEKLGIEMISTGGTSEILRSKGVKIRSVSEITGFPEILDGRVKTLHPKIHGGILAKRNELAHASQLKKHGIETIDLVVVNLYPFEETIANSNVKLEDAIEMIDIGGPAMIRSAAKNFKYVGAVCNPARYAEVLSELVENGRILSDDTLSALAVDAFSRTAEYDFKIYEFLQSRSRDNACFPSILSLIFNKVQGLRYGENPHQEAVFYADSVSPKGGFAGIKQLHGKELSFNNFLDLSSALGIVKDFDSPCACVVKHCSPCGIACCGRISEAFARAFACDSLSAFGGIVGLNRKVDSKTARKIRDCGFLECVIAPGYAAQAVKILMGKKNLRIIEFPDLFKKPLENAYGYDIKKVEGGLLVQRRDEAAIAPSDLKIMNKGKLTESGIKSLLFAWKAAKHVRSNAIVICKGERAVGIGGGQPSRVDSVRIALDKAGKNAIGAYLASDGFFPKPDSILLAAKAGIKAIIQPGGSVKDEEVIKAAKKSGIAMVFTGMRHFRH